MQEEINKNSRNKQQGNLLQQNIRKINLTIYKLIFMP